MRTDVTAVRMCQQSWLGASWRVTTDVGAVPGGLQRRGSVCVWLSGRLTRRPMAAAQALRELGSTAHAGLHKASLRALTGLPWALRVHFWALRLR